MSRKKKRTVSHENRVWWMAFFAGLPGAFVALILLWINDYTPKTQWTLTVMIVSLWFGFVFACKEQVIRPLQTISNLLAALREGDYSIRAKRYGTEDALNEAYFEANTLGETLREQRLGAQDAGALLRTVMHEIEVAVFAFDGEQKLRLVNRAGERLLTRPSEQLLGRTAADLNLAVCLEGDHFQILEMAFPGSGGRWEMHRTSFRQGGLPHQLLVLTDLSRALRKEERQAWQRLIRVLGHELNNSLAPIKSIAGSLQNLMKRQPPPADWQEDVKHGLDIVESRAEALTQFLGAYARLARLPEPQLQSVDVSEWIKRIISLETRMAVHLFPGPPARIHADPNQLDQILINLLRNAVDATAPGGGNVSIGWHRNSDHLEVWVEDDGPGLANTGNLFVPFFTTKPGGSGIGLALSRQIAEMHNGSLLVENRKDRPGCRATLRLPV